ncbi:hypothetical protein M1L60_03310 [Actinoplanes sp. TRM 88003]|uniref:Uncharacterized protein n=1 Tax=Paractinoplanes aksuensis TaxID=2939490 RepID=A0ABT1DHP7_9ACTN|nr:hypothetical protein [Actinoplanes aksuensis]MCO8269616.1 hypothetical protein [Actinoplanes aksuensis]
MAGLSTDELQTIRDGLAAGRKPRVLFTEAAGQMAGQLGQVIGLGDPAESDEWVVVKFGRDELPFSPGDLQIAPRGAVARKAAPAPAPAEPVAPPGPAFVLDQPAPAAKKAAKVNGAPVAGEDKPGAPAPRKGGDDVTAAPGPRKAAGRSAKPKPPPALTVTLAYGEGEWTVAASQGSKVLAKPYMIRPAEALRMVALVDVPGVHEAVEQILSAERSEAEEQARRLRAELAEVEARLAELTEKP